MTCDHAFDRLTAPAGHRDGELTAHLSTCTRCRAMAETLAPAIELFQGPGAGSDPHPEGVGAVLARREAVRLARRSHPGAGSVFRGYAGLLVAALGGAACCFLAVQLGQDSGRRPSPATCPRTSPEASAWMERHALPVAMACIACHPGADGPLTSAHPASPGSSL